MKKLYKNTLMQLIVALCTFSFVACQEFDIDSQPEGPLNIQIDAQDSYTANAISPSNIVFNISANTPWAITSSDEWCHVTPSMSASSSLVSEIVVSLDDNDGIVTPQERTATLTVTAEAINFKKTITITQYSKEKLIIGNIIDSNHDGMASADGETITFDIVSNKPWEIITYPEFVETITPTSGTGNADCSAITVSLTIAANNGARRSGDLTLRTDFEEQTFTITQDGINILPTDETQMKNSISSTGGTTTIPISANVDWKAEVAEEYPWLTATKDGENLIVTTAISNMLWPDFARTGYVTLSPAEEIQGFEPVQIEFTQTGVAYGIYWQNGSDRDVNYENNTVTIRSSAQNRWSWGWNTHFNTGKLTFQFESVDIPEGTAALDFNFDTWNGQPAGEGLGFWHLWIYGNNKGKLQAGKPFYFGDGNSTEFDLPVNTNDITSISFEVKETEGNPETLDATVWVNNEKAYTITVDNLFRKDPRYWGQLLYFGFASTGNPLATATFKSLDWEVYDYGYYD